MNVIIHSATHVEIIDGRDRIHLEYDQAGDFAEAVMAEPERTEDLASIALENELQVAIEQAANTIVNGRNSRPDERAEVVQEILLARAASDKLADYGFATNRSRMNQAFDIANADWRACQRSAGVQNPITAGERQAIYRTLEEA